MLRHLPVCRVSEEEVFHINEFGVAFVEVVDGAGEFVAEVGEEGLHGVVGEVGGGEEFGAGAEVFNVSDEAFADALTTVGGVDVEEGDEGIAEEGVFEVEKTEDPLVVFGQVAVAGGDGTLEIGAAVGLPGRVEVTEKVEVVGGGKADVHGSKGGVGSLKRRAGLGGALESGVGAGWWMGWGGDGCCMGWRIGVFAEGVNLCNPIAPPCPAAVLAMLLLH